MLAESMLSGFMSHFSAVLSQGLTPHERYEAMRRLGAGGEPQTSILTNRWFVLLAASVVFILTIVLLAVRRTRIEREKREALTKFNHEANRKGLTAEEREILLGIAKKAGVSRINTIFTIGRLDRIGQADAGGLHGGPEHRAAQEAEHDDQPVKVNWGFRASGRTALAEALQRGRRASIPEGRQVSIAPTHRSTGSH